MATAQDWYLTTNVADDLENIIPDTLNDVAPWGWPGYVGVSAENLATDAFIPHFLAASEGADAMGRNIDYQSYGESGEVNRNSYAIGGPVEPNMVEDFQLYGNVADGQRRPEYGAGPVGAYDHLSYTAMQVMQQMAPYAYDQEALASLLSGAA
jgi:hypothetical protein